MILTVICRGSPADALTVEQSFDRRRIGGPALQAVSTGLGVDAAVLALAPGAHEAAGAHAQLPDQLAVPGGSRGGGADPGGAFVAAAEIAAEMTVGVRRELVCEWPWRGASRWKRHGNDGDHCHRHRRLVGRWRNHRFAGLGVVTRWFHELTDWFETLVLCCGSRDRKCGALICKAQRRHLTTDVGAQRKRHPVYLRSIGQNATGALLRVLKSK